MSWRRGEIWLELEPRWFREAAEGGAVLFETNAPSFSRLSVEALTAAIPDGLSRSRRRRAELRRRRAARKTRAVALVVGPAVALTLAAPRLTSTSRASGTLAEDPPSQVDVRVDEKTPTRSIAPRTAPGTPLHPPVLWAPATSHGLPYAGSLSGGTQLPIEGADWATWNPVADRVPNLPNRLYGNDRVVRALLSVIAAYRAAHPQAPRVVVGDISFRGGGPMELHVSHQNGLDVDVYYPRVDGSLRAPTRVDQVDRRRAQGLLDAFLAVGVQKIFVGYRTGLSGPGDIVQPYPNHEDHMHVRFPGRVD
jgi:hypothetical protein